MQEQTVKKHKSVRASVQKFGSSLSNMVMPNIGALIAWGLITALFMASGYLPNKQLAEMIDPMLNYLLPILIGYTGGQMVHGQRGAVVGAIGTVGVIVGSGIPMFIGAMIMGPLGGWLMKKFDQAFQEKIKSGFEMLVNNFSAGIIGMLLAIFGYLAIGPVVTAGSNVLAHGVDYIISVHLLPLANVFIEPAKILFLNNAINHGILTPLGTEQAASLGKSILFLLEANPGPGLGVLLAFIAFGKGSARSSAWGAAVIHFLGGVHEIYFPYVLMKPALFLSVIAGGVSGTFMFQLLGAGLKAPASPGSIISLMLMSPKGGYLPILAGVGVATVVSFLVSMVILKADKTPDTESIEAAAAKMKDMKAAGSGSPEAIKAAKDTVASYANVQKIIFACDAGMGSSAMGASLLRDKMKKSDIKMSVTNTAISNLKEEPGLLVITQEELADRALEKTPKAMHVSVGNFLNSPKYDEIILNLKAANQIGETPAPVKTESANIQSEKVDSDDVAHLNVKDIHEIIFVHHDQKLGSATMATSMFKDRIKKAKLDIPVKNIAIADLQDKDTELVIATDDAIRNLKLRYTRIQVLAVDDLLNSPLYDKLIDRLKG